MVSLNSVKLESNNLRFVEQRQIGIKQSTFR